MLLKYKILIICLMIASYIQIPTHVGKYIKTMSKKVYETNINGSMAPTMSEIKPNKDETQKAFAELKDSLSNTNMHAYSAQINEDLNNKLSQTEKSDIDIPKNVARIVEIGMNHKAQNKELNQSQINFKNKAKILGLKKALAKKGLGKSLKFFSQVCTGCSNNNKSLSSQFKSRNRWCRRLKSALKWFRGKLKLKRRINNKLKRTRNLKAKRRR